MYMNIIKHFGQSVTMTFSVSGQGHSTNGHSLNLVLLILRHLVFYCNRTKYGLVHRETAIGRGSSNIL